MRRLLWVLAWIGVAVWSLFAWGTYGLFDFFGGLAVRNADAVSSHPETIEWLSWGFATLKGLGLAAIVAIWGFVALLILAVPAVLGLFLGGPRPALYGQPNRPHRGADGFPPASATSMRRIEKR